MAAPIDTNQALPAGVTTTNTSQVPTNAPSPAPPAGESHLMEILIIVGILVAVALFIWLGGINFIKKIFGTKRKREVRKIQNELVPRVN